MALSAQDKILYVANKLGLSSLGNMQGSTGAVYDVDTDVSGQIFSSASRHQNPSVTNITENQFEVNEALLVETIAFYVKDDAGNAVNFQKIYGSNAVIVFDLVIGNKRVMKDTPVFASGSPFTFANTKYNIFDENKSFLCFGKRETDCLPYELDIECEFIFELFSNLINLENTITGLVGNEKTI